MSDEAAPREEPEEQEPVEEKPSLQELWQRNAELGQAIDEHLGRARP
ncbi:hypothetical protein [Streptomyces sp. URMC 129]